MDFVAEFLEYCDRHQLLERGRPYLVAASGGLDSSVLCHLLFTQDFLFAIGHVNFRLRGAESDRDESFTEGLARRYGVTFHNAGFDTRDIALKEKLSLQVAARNLRYEWLEQIRSQHAYQAILTGHHLNDNAETVLMNLFKGTGIAGLHGIRAKTDHLVRPLLFASRARIEDYVRDQGLECVVDSSNLEDKYTRNILRHQVIPRIEEVFPEFLQNMKGNIIRFGEAELLYRQSVERHRKRLLIPKGREWFIPLKALSLSPACSTLIYEIFLPFGFGPAQVPEIQKLLQAETGSWIRSGTHRVLRDRNWLVIASLEGPASGFQWIQPDQGQSRLEGFDLHLQKRAVEGLNIPRDESIACLDARKLQFPLLVRRWKPGDYFYPLGFPKKKKLSRFFIDRKLSSLEKEKVWVLESGNRIAWVIGYRIDDRYKLMPGSREAWVIRIQK